MRSVRGIFPRCACWSRSLRYCCPIRQCRRMDLHRLRWTPIVHTSLRTSGCIRWSCGICYTKSAGRICRLRPDSVRESVSWQIAVLRFGVYDHVMVVVIVFTDSVFFGVISNIGGVGNALRGVKRPIAIPSITLSSPSIVYMYKIHLFGGIGFIIYAP